MGLVYFADWRAVLGKIPFVRGRFPPIVEASGGVPSTDEDGGDSEE